MLQIKPEYLLTISVADAITDGFSGIHGIDLTIKLEEPTRSICSNLMSNALSLRERFKRERHKVTRRGKVDIFVEHEKDCWIVELKGFNPSLAEINKDHVRLIEFLSANNWDNKCQGTFLAFRSTLARHLNPNFRRKRLNSGVKPLSAEVRKRKKGLAIRINIEVTVSILFGLEVWVFATLRFVKEVLMENPFVKSCVWCWVAFLRGHGGTLPIQTRGYQLPNIYPAERNVERFESSSSHQISCCGGFAA